ncbi:MAG: cardiolipin synthase [Planctomyces sp.]|nr:cardiolipin synthase [Planctomyces sp.]
MTLRHAVIGLLILYVLSLLLIRVVILTRRRHPASSVAWIFAIVALPFVGGLFFLVFGINRVNRRKRRRRQVVQTVEARRPSLEGFTSPVDEDPNACETERRIARLAARVEGGPVTVGNAIVLFNDTNIALRRIEEAIEAARSTIHLEYYIWQPDRTGKRVRDLLVAKARQGVQVRFLYDGLGSLRLTRKFLRPLVGGGAVAAPFVPGRNFRERWSINLRSHRKIVVVDGETGFTGGMNIGDEYHGRDKAIGYWRDTHLMLQGPAVLQLQQVFAEDWYYATGEELSGDAIFPQPRRCGYTLAQVISSGPDGETRELHSVMFAAINEARTHILLTTSYFVPTEPLTMALCTAAARGVRVRLIVPARSDHRWVVLAGRSYYGELLEAGVEIHEYRRGMMHAKTLTVDGVWSLVGTANFDPRSLLLNFEVGLALYDAAIARELEQHFEADLEHCRSIRREEWERRPVRSIFAENVCRLFSPVL